MAAESRASAFCSAVSETPAFDPVNLALRLTLLDLMLRPIGDWYLRPFIVCLAVGGLLLPAQLRRPGLWFALALLAGVRVVLDWPLADNHAYLLSYWCLAIGLALLGDNPRACLVLNGRLLIGLVFACATLWKLALSPDYLDGRFFRVTMLVDERFSGLTRIVGGLDPDLHERLRVYVERHADAPYSGRAGVPQEPLRFRYVAQFCSLWNIFIDGAIAIAFLSPVMRGIAVIRDGLLLFFCATTYAITTVEGFGWLLVAMGVAQTPAGHHRTRLLYVVTFALILFYREVPWADEIVTPLLDALAPAGP